MLIIITIINNNPSAIEGCFSTKTISINGVNHTSVATKDVPQYLSPAFTSESSAKDYYGDFYKILNGNTTTENYSYYFENDRYNFIDTGLVSGSIYNLTTSWNWKTGWLESSHYIMIRPDGSNSTEYQENLISFSSQVNSNSPASGFTLLTVLIIPLIVLFYKKRKI